MYLAVTRFPKIRVYVKRKPPVSANGLICAGFWPLRAGSQQPEGGPMRSIAYALPSFPGFAGPRTYAAWPVWKDSAHGEVRFAPLPKKEAARRWHKARRFDRQTHTPGQAWRRARAQRASRALCAAVRLPRPRHGPPGAVLRRDSGQGRGLPPHRRRAALKRLRELGLLHWQRRCHEGKDEAGNFRLMQETNAYAVLPPSHWRGYHEPPPAPPPDPGTWGDHPPLPDPITRRPTSCGTGQQRTALSLLDARSRRRAGRGAGASRPGHSWPAKPRNLLECRCCQEPLSHLIN